MLVEVTQDDINNGIKGDSCRCPIALASSRVTGKPMSTGGTYLRDINDQDVMYLLPIECGRFVGRFDKGLPVKPFSFDARSFRNK